MTRRTILKLSLKNSCVRLRISGIAIPLRPLQEKGEEISEEKKWDKESLEKDCDEFGSGVIELVSLRSAIEAGNKKELYDHAGD